MKPTIAIIGSSGKMGTTFSELFESRGFQVLKVDLDTELTGKEAISKADITIFSLPIRSTPQVIAELAPHAKPESLLTDLTSIKSPAIQAMETHAPDSCEVLGLHPMFGPQMGADLSKQVFAVCKVRQGRWAEFLLNLFETEGAILKETTPEEHDKMMSIIQGLTHLSSIATAMALQKLGFQAQESLEFSSPIYRLRLDMVGRILSQSPDLYADIAIENPLTQESLKAYQDSIQELSQLVSNADHDGFVSAFTQAAEYLGDFKDDAYRRTTSLIQRSKDLL
jgi:prephenate dehydrogenase